MVGSHANVTFSRGSALTGDTKAAPNVPRVKLRRFSVADIVVSKSAARPVDDASFKGEKEKVERVAECACQQDRAV